MKRLTSVIAAMIFAVLLSVCSASVGAAVYFEDTADIYDNADEIYIKKLMEEASANTGWNYGIVTLNEDYTSLSSAGRRAEGIYNEQFGVDSSGVLYMCDVGYRYFVIAGEARNYIYGARYNHMESKIKDLYFDYKDLECAVVFIEWTSDYYDRGPGSSDVSSGTFVLAAILGIAAAIGVYAGVNHHYNHYEKPATNNYLDRRTLNFYRKSDTFIRAFTVRHSNSSSSGSGGGGGGGFSGGSHGGGGFGGHR